MRVRRYLVVLVSVALLFLAQPGVFASTGDTAVSSAQRHLIVKFNSGVDPTEWTGLLEKYDLTPSGEVYGSGALVVGSKRDADMITDLLNSDPAVEYAEIDHVASATWIPNDSEWSMQWGLERISAPMAWEVVRGTREVMIAILDSGVDFAHPDLSHKVRQDLGYNFVGNNPNAQDDFGHGTHVAGVVAASTNNNLGIAGTCPECTILPIKVLDAVGNGTYSAVSSGIRYAVDKGAKVINMSLAGTSPSKTLRNALKYADKHGVVVICAAGNGGSDVPVYPAYYDSCISVAATDENDQKASFSNFGVWVDVSAPGTNIDSLVLGGGYRTASGTSAAAPQVSGLAGLLFSQGRSPEDVRERLLGDAYTDFIGSQLVPRRINALKAVTSITSTGK